MRVFIGSTYEDLKLHRSGVVYACQKLGLVPVNMEDFQPETDPGVTVSLKKVQGSDLYIGLFAYRYGYIPTGADKSVTEMEYDEATRLGLKRLIWCIDPDFDWPPKYVDRGPGSAKIQQFVASLQPLHTLRRFTTPEKLIQDVLVCLPEQIGDQRRDFEGKSASEIAVLPLPPKPYTPHRYSLLQVDQVIGRREELHLLTNWIKGGLTQRPCSVFCVVGVGGQGKSALTWHWFQDVAPEAMNPLEGRIWWSFYESSSSFETFITRSLAYLLGRPEKDVSSLAFHERCDELINILDSRSILVVLDGLERLLTAYMRLDAARIPDENAEKIQNIEPHDSRRFRQASDPNVARFVQGLLSVKRSRILISTRLFPADLESKVGGKERPGCSRLNLRGLVDDDALALWHSFVKRGPDPAELLALFRTFDKHPLLIQMLAGEVANFRGAPGDFAAWRHRYPLFDPFRLPLAQRRSHVLEHSLTGLTENGKTVLNLLSAFRMSADYGTVRDLLVPTSVATEHSLVTTLIELEDRNLVGWDRETNRYDLHPIVRGVVWSRISDKDREGVLRRIERHFELAQFQTDSVESIEDLAPSVEHFHSLIGLKQWDEASGFAGNIFKNLFKKLGGVRETVELLECLFPGGSSDASRYQEAEFTSQNRGFALAILGRAHRDLGDFETALAYFVEHKKYCADGVFCPAHEASVYAALGRVYQAECIFRHTLARTREENEIDSEARLLAVMHKHFTLLGWPEDAGAANRRLCKLLWTGEITRDTRQLIRAVQLEMALKHNRVPTIKRLMKLLEPDSAFDKQLRWKQTVHQAFLARRRNDEKGAFELYSRAVQLARAISDAEAEAWSIRRLAEIALERREYQAARDLMGSHFEIVQRSPIRVEQAEGQLLLSRLAEAERDPRGAISAAVEGFLYAWCDGPPFSYGPLLEEFRETLNRLGAEIPVLPAYSPGLTELWPNIELDPPEAPPRRIRNLYSRHADTGWLSRLETETHEDGAGLMQAIRDEDHIATIELADRLLANDENDWFTLAKRAAALWYTGKYERAEQDFSLLVENTNGGRNYLCDRGQVRAEMGKAEEALADLNAADEHPYALSGAGLALGWLGRYEEAFAAFDRSIQIAPSNAWVYFNRARVYERAGNTDAARADFSHSLGCASPPLPSFKRNIALEKVRSIANQSVFLSRS